MANANLLVRIHGLGNYRLRHIKVQILTSLKDKIQSTVHVQCKQEDGIRK